MKYKILKRFSDKETGELRLAGSFAEFETKRAKELIKLGFLEKPTEQPKKKSGE